MMRNGPLELTNRRGRSIPIDGRGVDWTIVVVVELPEGHPPFVPTIPTIEGKPPAIVLMRRDWDFLCRQLRSNYALVDYLNRVRGDQRMLGQESARYAEYAIHDMGPGLPHLLAAASATPAGQEHLVRPLPGDPVAQDDLEDYLMLRYIMEQIAVMDIGSDTSEFERLRLLTYVDSFPVIHRTRLGKALQSELAAAREGQEDRPDISYAIFSDVVDGQPISIYFGIAKECSDAVAREHGSARDLLYSHLCSILGGSGCVAIAIVLYPLPSDPVFDWRVAVKMQRG
jgi:hypothetical protein